MDQKIKFSYFADKLRIIKQSETNESYKNLDEQQKTFKTIIRFVKTVISWEGKHCTQKNWDKELERVGLDDEYNKFHSLKSIELKYCD